MHTLKHIISRSLGFVLVVALFMAAFAAHAAPVGSAFTYQGQLKFEGQPVTDPRDMEFGLYDDGGAQIGTTVTLSNVPVNDGLFNVVLDFGADAFGNEQRLLQITVKTPDVSTYTSLSPRVPITPAPVALSVVDNSIGTDALKAGSVTREKLDPEMEAYIAVSLSFPHLISNGGSIPFDVVRFNRGFGPYGHDGQFVIPTTGVYDVSYRITTGEGPTLLELASSLNGSMSLLIGNEGYASTVSGTDRFSLQAGDILRVRNFSPQEASVLGSPQRLSTLSIRRVE